MFLVLHIILSGLDFFNQYLKRFFVFLFNKLRVLLIFKNWENVKIKNYLGKVEICLYNKKIKKIKEIKIE